MADHPTNTNDNNRDIHDTPVEEQITNALTRRDITRSRGRWRWAFTILVILCVLGFVGSIASGLDDDENHIARVEINGVILHDRERLAVLHKLATDETVKAVLISIDSPGGATVGGEELYEAIIKLGAKKPVVASMQTTAASAGYMTAIAADHIFARRTTITASIGVLYQHVDAGELMQKIGVDLDKIATGPLKAEPDMDEALTPQVRASLQAMIDDSYNWFLDIVAERRDMELSAVRILADGRIVTGRQALELGLVDAIGGEAEAINWLETAKEIEADLPIHTHYPFPENDYSGALRRALGQSMSNLVGLPLIKLLKLKADSINGLSSSLSLDG